MRSQLRLRVLLPVALLGLMGMGVGAFAMGGPPGGTGAGTTATTTTTAPPPPPVTLAAWGDEADKLCATASRRLREAGYPTTPEQAALFLERYLEVYRDLDNGLAALPAPEGQKARMETLRALSAEGMTKAQAMLDAI